MEGSEDASLLWHWRAQRFILRVVCVAVKLKIRGRLMGQGWRLDAEPGWSHGGGREGVMVGAEREEGYRTDAYLHPNRLGNV
jgi:hypothetical protein